MLRFEAPLRLRSVAAVVLLLAGSLPASVVASESTAFFRQHVEPILQNHCFECHSHQSGKMKGGLTLDSRSGWADGGEHGPAIVPGDPEASRLIQAIRRLDPDLAMPPKQALEASHIQTLISWVRQGAPDPRVSGSGPTTNSNGQSAWWAVQPLRRPTVPRLGITHSVDAWAAEALTASGLELAPTADRRTLLRRLSVDLHGWLPDPAEVEAFEADPGSDDEAFRRQVDRYLASPRYGERWARHWLDVVHFAETHGHDQDRPRESAWPYRDYVIRSFNLDTPYPRFAQEQIAADVLFPSQPELIPALGFLAAGPWDESSLRDIREDVIDREIGRYLDRDDIVANVMSTFTGTTAHCARCHDHKFDPISQRDYYSLQAVFAGTEKAERLYDLDPTILKQRERWMRAQVAVDRRDPALVEATFDDALLAELREWESSQAARSYPWRALPAARVASEHGVVLTVREDHSIVASGTNPPADVYRVDAPAPPGRITGIRLEVLTDASLPKQGPGRAENGNLHLTDFRIFRVPRGAAESVEGEPVKVLAVSASFEQQDWGIAKAIDGEPASGWGIHPEEGKTHEAVFEVDLGPAEADASTHLRLVLKQEHGRQHTIGRFRLSTTSEAPPIRASRLPEAVARALRTPAGARAADDELEVRLYYLAQRATQELARLPEPLRVYAGASLFPPNANQKPLGRPRMIQVLRRGEVLRPIEEAKPGALACIQELPSRFVTRDDESQRRAEFAQWLTHPHNPLFWRTIVNRVWHYHFGRGIVDSPNDLGRMGGKPSAPALLDGLAVTFRDDLQGSMKSLHRLILTSATWRQRSSDPLSAHPLQPLGRRLDAETFRDSLLRLTDSIDLTMGGPSEKQFAMSPGIHVTPMVNYGAYAVDAPGHRRRSIYRFLFRTLPDPMMDVLDTPAGDQSAPVRGESFTALQALALLNHPFIVRQSERFAERLVAEEASPTARIERAVRLVWLRDPDASEAEEFSRYADRHGLPNLCRLLLNSNEYHFLQ
ncbi:MAG: PSD1 domain-containing protein [Verrucomicrobiales bacterium]|nr:PSD1 domain-containing protein [Verrucomicrobiales bacterium]